MHIVGRKRRALLSRVGNGRKLVKANVLQLGLDLWRCEKEGGRVKRTWETVRKAPTRVDRGGPTRRLFVFE